MPHMPATALSRARARTIGRRCRRLVVAPDQRVISKLAELLLDAGGAPLRLPRLTIASSKLAGDAALSTQGEQRRRCNGDCERRSTRKRSRQVRLYPIGTLPVVFVGIDVVLSF